MRANRRRPRPSHAAIERARGRSLTQLGLMIAILAMMIYFWHEISQGAAGCFSRMATGQGGADGGADLGAPATDTAKAGPDAAPAVRVRVAD